VITEKQIDKDKETGSKVGTTGRGIGPCYMAKIERTGIRMVDFAKQNSPEAKKLKPFVADTYVLINKAIEEQKNILIEGAQATMLDIDHGTYPFVTSSNPTAGGQCVGLGIGPTKIDEVIGIQKAYTTRVGRGPFPTELGTDEDTTKEGTWDKIESIFEKQLGESAQKANAGDIYHQGKYLRLMGREYGTTTGRPRRTGWFDAVIARYARKINGFTSYVLTKADCFQGLKKIKICVAYDIDGKITEDFPIDMEKLAKAKPVYEEMDGWQEDISGAKSLDELPKNCLKYVKRIEQLTGVPMSILSVGPKRDETIIVNKKMLF
ncbi:MAG TPA: adenylosuccinate synthetase, partial [Candidatus Nanoarchaeia archaeon]|nr:adenylosuccinate synthetase [Candidatus Nanoarchaeia archaeon]